MSGFNKAPRIVTAAAVGISMSGVLSACSLGTEDVYCVDENNVVVDEALCDDTRASGGGTGAGYFFLIGAFGGGFGPGTRLDGSRGTRISSTDRAARAQYGLPRSGTVSNGTKSSTGFGKGGTSDSGKGGWGGGNKSGG